MSELNKQSVFAALFDINVNEHVKKKVSLSYLSWAWAWAEVKKLYPDATYTIYKDENQRPYMEDPDMGLMCYTTVTIEGLTHEMWLPVMDGANRAMRKHRYSYKVYNSKKNEYEERFVEGATMFDVNKTLMRCLVKNLAMFGIGLYIYADEDLPEAEVEAMAENELRMALEALDACKDVNATGQVWMQYSNLQMNAKFRDAIEKKNKSFSRK